MALLTPDSVYRRYETEGVPESGAHEPKKSEIIQLLNMLFGSSRGGWVVARTLSELNGITPENETDGGVVLTGSGTGYYDRDSGAWVFGRGFPDTFALLVDVGGSANAITASVSPGIDPGNILCLLLPDPPGTNSSPAVTLTIDGVVHQVKSSSGNGLAVGDIVEGVGTLLFKVGAEWWQLFSSAAGAMFDHQGTYAASTTYTQGQIVTGSDGNWYQLKTPSAQGDNPVGSVTGAWLQILLGAVLPDGSVTTQKLSNQAVTTGKLADDAVTGEKVAPSFSVLITAQVASVSALKALDTSGFNVAYLRGADRGGVFFLDVKSAWTSLIAADVNEGLIIASTDDVTKCWVRDVRDPWWSRWFSIPEDAARNGSGSNSAPAFNAMIACANLQRPSEIVLAPAWFNFEAAITTPTFILGLRGSRGGTTSTGSPTVMNKKIASPSNASGMFSFANLSYNLANLVFVSTAGSGGCYISNVPTAVITGEPKLRDCSLNGSANIAYALVLNGTGVSPLGQGLRNFYAEGCSFFNGQVGSALISGLNNGHFSNCEVFTAGGSGTDHFRVTGDSSTPSTHVVFQGAILGNLALDYCQFFSLAGHVAGAVANTSNVTNTTLMRATGTVQTNWGASNKVLAGA